MKRNCFATTCEIIFPMLLMILLVIVKNLFTVTDTTIQVTDSQYLVSNSTSYLSLSNLSTILPKIQANPSTYSNYSFYGLPLNNGKMFYLCNSTNRPAVGIVGTIPNGNALIAYLTQLGFIVQNYASIQALKNYVSSQNFQTSGYPGLCFGLSLNQTDSLTFNYSLLYFDGSGGQKAYQDIPLQQNPSLNIFQYGPDLTDYKYWTTSGYFEMMTHINNIILQITTNSTAQLNVAVAAQKFSEYKNDPFSKAIAFILPFFLVIAYVCPLCILVYRMTSDKETRAKEGMKIMGLSEGVYFLSYFLNYLILNTIYSFINAGILTRVMSVTPYQYIFLFFWLFGLSVFALGYFFQSFIDKTRIAVIISLIFYFIMYFITQTVSSNQISNSAKMGMSIFPPLCLSLGLQVFAQFESAFVQFGPSYMNFQYQNYAVGNMYVMFVVDIIIYLFLGFYLQNVIPQQFGTRQPFYFLCTKNYWCKSSRNEEVMAKLQELKEMSKNQEKPSAIQIEDETKDHFQREDNYDDQIKSGDYLRINNIVKVYDDGKEALSGLSLNIYNNEIFALLGHNGAGKSTLISILCGLYETTSGEAFYKNDAIFQDMTAFRKNLGICPQHDVLFDKLTVKEHLDMFSVFKGIPSEQRDNEVAKTIVDMQLLEKQDDLIENLSGGQKRKLSIGIALVGGSKVVFLDEPSSGMDITSRRKLWDILKTSCSDRIIVLTTHYMEEATVLGNRIGIVSNGKLKCSGSSLFLIDRFGKSISLTVSKEKGASDEDILSFIKERIKHVESEVLSEEILIKFPKNEDMHLKKFFSEFDANTASLKIKSYGVSMPTLEDVFLNVSADLHLKKDKDKGKQKKDENQVSEVNGYSYDMYDRTKEGEVTGFAKFCVDLNAGIFKRFKQLIRDKKSFILEMLCPLFLVLIGLFVASVDYQSSSSPKQDIMSLLPTPQNTTYNSIPYAANGLLPAKIFQSYSQETFGPYNNPQFNSSLTAVTDFMDVLFLNTQNNSLAGYYVLNTDTTNKIYDGVVMTNIIAQDGPVIFLQDYFSQMIKAITGQNVTIMSNCVPLPMTWQISNDSQIRNVSNLIFFVSIAFALIPANFITIIIREKQQNTKHLQIVSGISLLAYWIANFLFELVKYYITGAISLGLMAAFNLCPSDLWIIYFFYGLAMIPFTYIFSYVFSMEGSAQNFIILLNFLFGALAGTIIFFLRTDSDTISAAQGITAVFRIIPSYALSYGFNNILSANVLAATDGVKSINDLAVAYAGGDIIYLSVVAIVSVIIMFVVEIFQSKVSFSEKRNTPPQYEINDTVVREEIDLINDEKTDRSDMSVEVRNLEKNYGDCCTPMAKNSVDKLSFHLKKGECFALLGLNGAGKTTTFKCLTMEIFPTKGQLFINGIDVSKNFESVRKMIGYCPQFDAIFDYMTVFENLWFYSCVKGIPDNRRAEICVSLMKEMNLNQFADKEAGNLSGGNKRKLSVAIALIGNPEIVLLDEPSTGVDPEARRFMWSVIHKISVTRKHSSVILTTHSMEEAETLCRRMGIMVQGQFRCLGTAQTIKAKYGSGYEIDLRINNLSEETLAEQLGQLKYAKEDVIEDNAVRKILHTLDKEKYIEFLKPDGIGAEIYEEFSTRKTCSIKKLLNWLFYAENILGLCGKLLGHYSEITVAEFYENNYKLKLKPHENGNTTIGFLFGQFDDYKTEFSITEYGISQTSLEQIFNRFAREAEEKSNLQNNIQASAAVKPKINVTKQLLESIDIKLLTEI